MLPRVGFVDKGIVWMNACVFGGNMSSAFIDAIHY